MGDGKAKSVMLYLDYLSDKGKASAGAIKPLKVAFSKVLQVIEGDTWEDTDVRTIDVDDYMDRFANLTMGKYTSETLTAYKSRTNKAVAWYRQFLDKPGWTPDVQRRNRQPKIKSNASITRGGESKNIPVSTETAEEAQPHISNAQKSVSQISYPYPLINGELITINLPLKLTKKDAKRIGIFIESIAVDEQLALGPGHKNANDSKS